MITPRRWKVWSFKKHLRRAALTVTIASACVSLALLLRIDTDPLGIFCVSFSSHFSPTHSQSNTSLFLQTTLNILLNHLIPRTLINPTLLLLITTPLVLRPY